MWSVVLLKPGDDPHVGGVVITYVDDLLITGWQQLIDAITQTLLAKYVMNRSGSLPYGDSKDKSSGNESEGVDFLGARTHEMPMELCGVTSLIVFSIVVVRMNL